MGSSDRLDAVFAVREASRKADGHDPLDEAASLHLKHHGLTGARLETTDAHDGFALVLDGGLDLAVHPEARGQGVGTALADAITATSNTSVTSGEQAAQRAWSHGDHPAAVCLARRHGWERSRELWVMRLAASVDLPERRNPPDGVRIREYTDADAAAVLATNAAAFAHHPEQGDLDETGLAERMAEDWFDPAGLLLAVDAHDQLLGFHWTKRHSPTQGEVYVVAIDPGAQGRGLGSMLTLAGLVHLRDHGVVETHLYVESDNLPARAVYERLGFSHDRADTHVQYTAP